MLPIRLSRNLIAICLLASGMAQAHEGYDKAIQAYSCVDYPKAYSLFKTYADQGHGLSQYMVGIMLEQGQGTDSDVNAAYQWYLSSAKQGLADAYFALGDLYARGVGVGKDLIQAYAWFELANRAGHKLAKDMVASLAGNLQGDQITRAMSLADEWAKSVKK